MSIFRFTLIAFTTYLWLNLGLATVQAQKELRLEAGAATVNITPPLGELVVGGFSPLPADDVTNKVEIDASVKIVDRLMELFRDVGEK